MNLEVPEERSGKPLVDKDAPMLGVVDEFDHVESAVVRLNEMSLGASPHFSYQASSLK
jgi:hypothetical protein